MWSVECSTKPPHFNPCLKKVGSFSPFVCRQLEARVTQYERDFDRIGMTVHKEVLRFEVCWEGFLLMCHQKLVSK